MLYLVATPIGNLDDITLRALKVLRNVDLIASEDTRKTSILLNHYEIHKPQKSYHAFNEKKVVPKLIEQLLEGKSIAVVTSAGTPTISDPGYSLVRSAIDNDIPVTAIPGPAAVIMALSLSGLPAHSFIYKGFSPRKTGARQRFIAEDAKTVLGDRRAALANDLTKKFESITRGLLSELIEALNEEPPRGEYTVVIEGNRD